MLLINYVFFRTFLCLIFYFTFYLAQAQTFILKATLKVENENVEVQNIRFSPDGKTLAGGYSNGNVVLWSMDSLKSIITIKAHEQRVLEVSFDRAGTKLATASEDGSCTLWTFPKIRNLMNYQCTPYKTLDDKELKSISFVAFSPDNSRMYFGGDSGYLMQANLSGLEPQLEVLFSTNYDDGRWYSTITGGCISPDGKFVVISVGQLIDFISIDNRQLDKYFRYKKGYLNDVVEIPNKNQIATWSNDGRVNIWDCNTGNIEKDFKITTAGNYSGATFDREAKLLATGADQKIAKVWDIATGKQIATLEGHEKIVRICRFSPKENLLATASYDGTIKIWSYE
jgi:WD40 repeat protein